MIPVFFWGGGFIYFSRGGAVDYSVWCLGGFFLWVLKLVIISGQERIYIYIQKRRRKKKTRRTLSLQSPWRFPVGSNFLI